MSSQNENDTAQPNNLPTPSRSSSFASLRSAFSRISRFPSPSLHPQNSRRHRSSSSSSIDLSQHQQQHWSPEQFFDVLSISSSSDSDSDDSDAVDRDNHLTVREPVSTTTNSINRSVNNATENRITINEDTEHLEGDLTSLPPPRYSIAISRSLEELEESNNNELAQELPSIASSPSRSFTMRNSPSLMDMNVSTRDVQPPPLLSFPELEVVPNTLTSTSPTTTAAAVASSSSAPAPPNYSITADEPPPYVESDPVLELPSKPSILPKICGALCISDLVTALILFFAFTMVSAQRGLPVSIFHITVPIVYMAFGWMGKMAVNREQISHIRAYGIVIGLRWAADFIAMLVFVGGQKYEYFILEWWGLVTTLPVIGVRFMQPKIFNCPEPATSGSPSRLPAETNDPSQPPFDPAHYCFHSLISGQILIWIYLLATLLQFSIVYCFYKYWKSLNDREKLKRVLRRHLFEMANLHRFPYSASSLAFRRNESNNNEYDIAIRVRDVQRASDNRDEGTELTHVPVRNESMRTARDIV